MSLLSQLPCEPEFFLLSGGVAVVVLCAVCLCICYSCLVLTGLSLFVPAGWLRRSPSTRCLFTTWPPCSAPLCSGPQSPRAPRDSKSPQPPTSGHMTSWHRCVSTVSLVIIKQFQRWKRSRRRSLSERSHWWTGSDVFSLSCCACFPDESHSHITK